MIYLLYGQDTYRRDQKLGEILAAYAQKHPAQLGLMRLDADTAELTALSAALESAGLFETVRLVVARGFFGRCGEALTKFVTERNLQKDTSRVLVLVEEVLGKEGAALTELAKVQRFDLLSPQKLRAWIHDYVSQRALPQGPTVISGDAVEFVAAHTQSLWEAANILEQAIAAAAGVGVVEKKDITQFLERKTEEKVFPAGDAAVRRDAPSALEEIEKLSGQGEDMTQVGGYVLSAVRNVCRAHVAQEAHKSSDVLAKKFGLHPYVARKALEASRLWDKKTTADAMAHAVQFDRDRKFSRAPARLTLDAFIVRSTT